MIAKLDLPNLKLQLDVPTRWNSTLQMAERFLRLKAAVFAAISDLPQSEVCCLLLFIVLDK